MSLNGNVDRGTQSEGRLSINNHVKPEWIVLRDFLKRAYDEAED